MKIAVYTMCKNEEKNIADWRMSCEGADWIVVADTGSTDGTMKELRKAKIVPHRIAISPWRWDDAHNAALSLVPLDVDICIPLHLDERLQPGWREKLENAWVEGANNASYLYEYSPDHTFVQNRIHARKGWRWRFPCHEGLYQYGDIEPWKRVHIDSLLIKQNFNADKDKMESDYKLTKMGIEEAPDEPRMNHYFGRQLMYLADKNGDVSLYGSALFFLERYMALDHPDKFPYEISRVMGYIAHCRKRLNQG